MPSTRCRGLRGLGSIDAIGSEWVNRSWTAARDFATAVAASNEIGALDERAKQDLFDGLGERGVRVAIHSE